MSVSRNQVARSLLGVVLSSSIVLAGASSASADQSMGGGPPMGAPPAAAPAPPPPPAAPAPAPPGQVAQPGQVGQPAPAGAAAPAPTPAEMGPADVTSDAPVAPKGSGYTNSKVPAYLAFGVAGLGLVAGTAFGISALSAKSTYNDTPTYKKAEAVENRSLGADIGFATFLIAGVTGAIFYLNEGAAAASAPPAAARRAAPTRTGLRIEPTVTPRVQGASLTLRF